MRDERLEIREQAKRTVVEYIASTARSGSSQVPETAAHGNCTPNFVVSISWGHVSTTRDGNGLPRKVNDVPFQELCLQPLVLRSRVPDLRANLLTERTRPSDRLVTEACPEGRRQNHAGTTQVLPSLEVGPGWKHI